MRTQGKAQRAATPAPTGWRHRRWQVALVTVALGATLLVASSSSGAAFCATGEGSYYRLYEQSIYEEGGLSKLGVVRHEIAWCVKTVSGVKSISKKEVTVALIEFDPEVALEFSPTPTTSQQGNNLVISYYRVQREVSNDRKRPIGRVLGESPTRDASLRSSTTNAIPVIYYLKTDGTNTRSGWSPKIVTT